MERQLLLISTPPKNLEEDKLLSAIVIGAPYGSTKEQAAAIYANTFAQLGFVPG